MPPAAAITAQLEDHEVLSVALRDPSEANLNRLAVLQVGALVADQGMRKRDARFVM